MFFNNKFILASSSLSRYKILKKNNLNFTKTKPKCNENFLKKKLIKKKVPAKKISLVLARLKAKSISLEKKKIIVVGSDTVISFEGTILSKAKNFFEAKKIIKKICGKKHNIYSSASAFYDNKEIWNFTQKSTVKIRELSNKEIQEYLRDAGKNILSSVGCYQAESLGPNIIQEIKGDFFNVLGFPLFPFLIFLRKYQIKKAK